MLSKKSQELLGRNDFGLDQYLKKFSNSKDITKKDIDTLVQIENLIEYIENTQNTNDMNDEEPTPLSLVGEFFKGGFRKR